MEKKDHAYERLFRQMDLGVIFRDSTGKIILSNDAAEEIFGVPLSEIANLKDDDLATLAFTEEGEELPLREYPPIKALHSGEAVSDYVMKFCPPGKKPRWIQVTSIPEFHDGEETPFSVFSTFSDITERREALKKLKENEEFIQLVMDNIPQFIFWKNRESIYLGSNRNFARAAGIDDPVMIAGKSDFDLAWQNSEAEAFRCDDKIVMDSGEPLFHIIEPQLQSDGKQAWLDTNKIPLKGESGEVIGILGTFEDITDRITAEKELKNLQQYLSSIINSMPSILIGIDRDYRVTLWNDEAVRLTGVSVEKSLGRYLFKLPIDLNDISQKVVKAIEQGQPLVYQRDRVDERGENIRENVIIYPLTKEQTDGAVIRIDDITDRVKIEEMMIQSEKMLSVGGLAAGMAHEINNPLAGMMQTANVMSNRLNKNLRSPTNQKIADELGLDLERVEEFLEKRGIPRMTEVISDSGRRVADIVTNMLSFARKVDSGYSSIDMKTLLESTLELAKSDSNLKGKYDFKYLRIIKEINEDLPLNPVRKVKSNRCFSMF